MTRPRACVATGVAAGLATHLGWPVALVRAAFVVTSLAWGAGLLLYLWLWVLTPWEEGEARPTRRAPVAWLLVAASAVLLVIGWTTPGGVVESGGNGLGWWFGALVAGVGLAVAAGAWATLVDRPDPERGPRQEFAVRVVVTALLAITALVLVLGPIASWYPVPTFAAALTVVLGILLVYVPTLIAKWRELTDERTKRIREEQRSEIAAHLHDSVLQTLALIQNRAGATSEVARIARAQERELRDWLFAGDAPADSDLGTDLRDFAADLEIDYPVTVDVVAVGEQRERASGELAAAAREAMLNAARHAGGEISVYVESTPDAVEVFVRDRGPGFALAEVPSDRLGVRQSIIGRMRRAGGSATVAPGAGGVGTEVRLRFPVDRQATERSGAEASHG
ncbi:PspC domain-containing protein [Agromyces endophyticus]|uniref:ATP-binding protein n=1 Tax=Agromyces sp. H17E-10 TaxID=2932244 RepID=UPI001FD0E3C8|nr:ATP-binding protein [Agromyces sp. H17E-10]UOQ90443.1 PspC domain-containing protein [Agromyces sp. H17E-10]